MDSIRFSVGLFVFVNRRPIYIVDLNFIFFQIYREC